MKASRFADLGIAELLELVNGAAYLLLPPDQRAEVKAPAVDLLPENFEPIPEDARGYDETIFGCPKVL